MEGIGKISVKDAKKKAEAEYDVYSPYDLGEVNSGKMEIVRL